MSERPPPTPHAERQRVVIVYTAPMMDIIADNIAKIRANGGVVHLLGPQIRGYETVAEAADGCVFLRRQAAPVYVDPDNRPRRFSARWAAVVVLNLTRKVVFKPAQRTLGAATLWWLAASHNPHALDLLDSADVLTAVDGGAVYLVWEAARRNRHAAAINGIGPTLEHLGLAR